jgi:uncharacterized protein (TIGR02265 family)
MSSLEGSELKPDPVVELVRGVCDLEERLALVPASAQGRGLYFQSIEEEVKRAGHFAGFAELLQLPDGHRAKALQWYPVREYMRWICAAAYLMKGREQFQQGLFDLGYAYSNAFMNTILGRTMLRVLSRDPVRLLQQGVSGRKHSTTYGKWTCHRYGEREMGMIYESEYVWIESVFAGAAKGSLDACGVNAELVTHLSGRFAGETRVRW